MEKYGFFASLDGDRKYNADDFTKYFGNFFTTGYFPTTTDALQVIANGTNRLTLRPGKAWIEGRVYYLEEPKELEIPVGDALLSRIDLVCIRCDYQKREIYAYIKQGQLNSNPVAPKPQRDSDAYEIAVASYRVDKGITSVEQKAITDTRKDLNYCSEVTSLIDKHTLKDFCRKEGFTMEGTINALSILPVKDAQSLGNAQKPWGKIVTRDLQILNGIPYMPLNGGVMKGAIYSEDIIPNEDATKKLGAVDKRFSELHVNNLKVYGETPYFNKTGGTISGGVKLTYRTTKSGDYQTKWEGYDDNGQGDGHTYIGYNQNGQSTHMFRGKGTFSVANPICLLTDTRMQKATINNKQLFIQPGVPSGAKNGDVWIKTT